MANGKNSDLDILLNARLDLESSEKSILSDVATLTNRLKNEKLELKVDFNNSEFKGMKKEIEEVQKSMSDVGKNNVGLDELRQKFTKVLKDANINIKDIDTTMKNLNASFSKKREIMDSKNPEMIRKTIYDIELGAGRMLKVIQANSEQFELTTNRAKAQEQVYKQLNQLAREESQLRTKMLSARGDELKELQRVLDKNLQKQQAQREEINNDQTHLHNMQKEIDLNNKIDELLDKQLLKQSQITQREKERIDRLGEKVSGDAGIEGIDFKNIKAVNEYVQALMGAELTVNSVKDAHTRLRSGISDTSKQMYEVTATQKISNNQLKELRLIVDENSNSMYKLGEAITPIPNKMMGIVSQMGEAIIKSAQWAVAMDLIYGNLRRLREGIEIVKALDVELTNVAVTLGLSRNEAKAYADTIVDTAINLRRSVADVSQVNTELVRQGLSLEESAKRMETVMKFASVGDMGASDSLKVITSSVNALGEEAEKTADVLLMAGQISASSAEEIGDAFTKVASSARATGVDIEELSAILSTLIEVTQESPSSLGNSLKTLISRFNQINEETGELNEDLNKVQAAFESVGVAFTDAEGQIRPLYELLSDLSPIWNDLDKNTRSYISTQAAGKIKYIVPVSIAI